MNKILQLVCVTLLLLMSDDTLAKTHKAKHHNSTKKFTIQKYRPIPCVTCSNCHSTTRCQLAATRYSHFAVGKASWYGGRWHGRRTASGERFNKHAYTAAHKSLPFGSKILVTNLQNHQSVVVTINDRGPFVRGRIIDLSQAAAEAIDLAGTGAVKLTALN